MEQSFYSLLLAEKADCEAERQWPNSKAWHWAKILLIVLALSVAVNGLLIVLRLPDGEYKSRWRGASAEEAQGHVGA